ncbi:MAG: hypothetical protein Q8N61_01255 [bacterium]|nr:hypothetical protein [bacterium]
MKNKNNSKELKINFKFNNDISEEESDRIWFQVFDILFSEDEEYLKIKN